MGVMCTDLQMDIHIQYRQSDRKITGMKDTLIDRQKDKRE